MKYCIWEVHDGDKVYNRVDISDKDIEEFIDKEFSSLKVDLNLIKLNAFLSPFTISPLFHCQTQERERERFKSVQAHPRPHHSLQMLLQPFFPNHLTSIPYGRPGGRDPITSAFS